jgi:hypothetical protein
VQSASLSNPISPAQIQLVKRNSNTNSTNSATAAKRSSRLSSNGQDTIHQDFDYADLDDPYEVIHCKCGNHVNTGFMIQCEICLCWQHGECAKIKTAKCVPKNYFCWICKMPSNKLKQLKYQNWMSEDASKSNIKLKENNETNVEDAEKLQLLNECSKKYYNLNLLMYTLEYQMSVLSQLTKNEPFFNKQQDQLTDADLNEVNEEAVDQVEKLLQNIAHLQNCLSKRFNEFNSKIDGKYLFCYIFHFNSVELYLVIFEKKRF